MWILILKIILQLLTVGIMLVVNLLDYVTRDKRTRRFKTTRHILFVVSGVFLVVSIFVIVIDEVGKRNEIQQLRHPITDVSVSFQVNMPLHPPLSGYRKRLESGMNEAISEFTRSQSLPYNLTVRNNYSVNIPNNSILFPNAVSERLEYYLINHVGLRVEFHKAHKEFSSSLKDPALDLPDMPL